MENKEQTVTLTREEWWMIDTALLLLKRNEQETGEFWTKMAATSKECEEAHKFWQFALDREESRREIERVVRKIKEERFYADH